MQNVPSFSFEKVVTAAFPQAERLLAVEVTRELKPYVVKDRRRPSLIEAVVQGRRVAIPERLHFSSAEDESSFERLTAGAYCILSRSTNGYTRQRAVETLVSVDNAWVIPFIVLLIGDHVVEIVQPINLASSGFDRSAYAEFVRENRTLMRRVMARATRSWNLHYRRDFPNRLSYPGWEVLRQLNTWAA